MGLNLKWAKARLVRECVHLDPTSRTRTEISRNPDRDIDPPHQNLVQLGTPWVTGHLGTPRVTGQLGTPWVTGQLGTPRVTGQLGTPGVTGQLGTPWVTGQLGTPWVTGQLGTPWVTGRVRKHRLRLPTRLALRGHPHRGLPSPPTSPIRRSPYLIPTQGARENLCPRCGKANPPPQSDARESNAASSAQKPS